MEKEGAHASSFLYFPSVAEFLHSAFFLIFLFCCGLFRLQHLNAILELVYLQDLPCLFRRELGRHFVPPLLGGINNIIVPRRFPNLLPVCAVSGAENCFRKVICFLSLGLSMFSVRGDFLAEFQNIIFDFRHIFFNPFFERVKFRVDVCRQHFSLVRDFFFGFTDPLLKRAEFRVDIAVDIGFQLTGDCASCPSYATFGRVTG